MKFQNLPDHVCLRNQLVDNELLFKVIVTFKMLIELVGRHSYVIRILSMLTSKRIEHILFYSKKFLTICHQNTDIKLAFNNLNNFNLELCSSEFRNTIISKNKSICLLCFSSKQKKLVWKINSIKAIKILLGKYFQKYFIVLIHCFNWLINCTNKCQSRDSELQCNLIQIYHIFVSTANRLQCSKKRWE